LSDVRLFLWFCFNFRYPALTQFAFVQLRVQVHPMSVFLQQLLLYRVADTSHFILFWINRE